MGCLFVDLRRNVQIKWLLSLARLIQKSFVYKNWANKPRDLELWTVHNHLFIIYLKRYKPNLYSGLSLAAGETIFSENWNKN